MRVLYVLLLVLIASPAIAATHYVRDGGTCVASCTDWTNAFDQLTSAETAAARGDTVYVADGTYTGVTFDTAASSTTRITIQKATVASHGTSTGWLDTYGDGQAVFTGPLHFGTGYWTFDGATRNESDWFDGTAYGFKISGASDVIQIYFDGVSVTNSITIQYVWSAAREGTIVGCGGGCAHVDTRTSAGSGHVFSHNLLSGSVNGWFLLDTVAPTIEYNATRDFIGCAGGNCGGEPENHCEVVNLYWGGDGAIVRYNNFRDTGTDPTLFSCTAVIAITNTTGHRIYGNVFDGFTGSDAAIGFIGSTSTDIQVYNNTFIDGNISWGCGVQLASNANVIVQNNLFLGGACDDPGFSTGMTRSYNAYGGASNGETNGQFNVSSSIFVGYATHDLRLTGATTAGTSLASPYNVDVTGRTRGADGTWDRGAFDFVVAAGSSHTISGSVALSGGVVMQ